MNQKKTMTDKPILNTGDLELLIDDVRAAARDAQKLAMADEMRALPLGKRLTAALKIVFKR